MREGGREGGRGLTALLAVFHLVLAVADAIVILARMSSV